MTVIELLQVFPLEILHPLSHHGQLLTIVCEETCDQEEEERETVSFYNGIHYNVEVESNCTKVRYGITN